jgi:hypothetical protein
MARHPIAKLVEVLEKDNHLPLDRPLGDVEDKRTTTLLKSLTVLASDR